MRELINVNINEIILLVLAIISILLISNAYLTLKTNKLLSKLKYINDLRYINISNKLNELVDKFDLLKYKIMLNKDKSDEQEDLLVSILNKVIDDYEKEEESK